MQLMMYLNNDLIEAVPIHKESLRLPGYLGKFKRTLKLKYSDILKQCPDKPEFLVIDPTPVNTTYVSRR